jgi:hypothetical protein
MDITTAERPYDLHSFMHPASVFDHPDQVLRDDTLSRAEKRVILSSWASDANAVESQPWLRLIPGAGQPVPLAAILDALRRLDDGDPPPKGGATIRLRSRSRSIDDWSAAKESADIEEASWSGDMYTPRSIRRAARIAARKCSWRGSSRGRSDVPLSSSGTSTAARTAPISAAS